MSRERYRQSVFVSTDVRPGSCWAPLCHPYGVCVYSLPFSHRFRGGLRCFFPPGLSKKSNRFTAEVAASGWRPSEVKWNRVPNFRIYMLCHETQTLDQEKQPQPLLETPKIVKRLMNGDRFYWRTGTGSL